MSGHFKWHSCRSSIENQTSSSTLRSALGSILRRSAPVIAVAAFAVEPQAFAQNTAGGGASSDDNLEEIVVTGIRSSLQNSQEIKKNAEVFVDSVTAEDIGALPDRSVTEALQRIPGVAINRFAGANDPDHFSIEGSGVVVRGLTQVRSELNGRDTFSANNGRFLSFSDVPPELLGGVDVFKNQSADMIEGGLAGTVNLRTRVPFDSEGQQISVNAEANYGDFSEKTAPTASALYTNRWDTGIGEIGLLASAVYSELKSRSDGTQISNFRKNTQVVPGDEVWLPQGAAIRTQDYDRERTGGAFAAQWKSNDDTMLATLQFMRSDANTSWSEHAIEVATDVVAGAGGSRFVGTDFGFDDSKVFTHGTLTSNTGWRDDQNTAGNNRTPAVGLQSNNIARSVDQNYVTSDYGLNFKWTPNDAWGFNFDFQHVESTVSNLDMTIWGASFEDVSIDNRSGVPKVVFLQPSPPDPSQCNNNGCPTYFSGSHNSFSDPYNNFWRSAMDHAEDSEGDENAFRLDVDRKFENLGFITGLKFGGRYSERDNTTRYTKYNWGSLSEIWGSGGPVWFDDPVNGNPAVAGGAPSSEHTELFTFDNFMRGSGSVPAIAPFYSGNLVKNGGYAEVSQFAGAIRDEWRAYNSSNGDWYPLADPRRGGPDSVHLGPGGRYLPNEINDNNETTKALYVMARFGNQDKAGDGVSISGNIGVRWVRTELEASGNIAYPTAGSLTEEENCTNPKDPTAPLPVFCFLSPQERANARAFSTGLTVPDKKSNSYDRYLPSFNLKVGLTPDLLLRFGFAKAMARADFGLTRDYFNLQQRQDSQLGWLGFQGDPNGVGNPYLKPVNSTNFDGSIEWYFSKVGSLTFSAFYKSLSDVLTNGTSVVPFTNGGQTYNVFVVTPVNAKEKGTVQGFELGYQQVYDFLPGFWSGFGIQANYTYIDSQGVPQSTLSNGTNDVGAGLQANVDTSLLPLQGLSKDNVNFAIFYEKGPISTRLAYNWRSKFLLTVRDVIVPYAPIFNEATGQLDGSFFYNVTDNVKIGLQGVNLLNEVTKTSQVLEVNEDGDALTAGRSWFVNDRRLSLVARVNF